MVDRNERTTLIDVACTWDKNVEDEEIENVNKYQDLNIELQRIWETSVTVVPVALGVPGATSNNLNKYLLKLKTANNLRRHLGISGTS